MNFTTPIPTGPVFTIGEPHADGARAVRIDGLLVGFYWQTDQFSNVHSRHFVHTEKEVGGVPGDIARQLDRKHFANWYDLANAIHALGKEAA